MSDIELSEEEREPFERILDRHEPGDDLWMIADAVLKTDRSTADDDTDR